MWVMTRALAPGYLRQFSDPLTLLDDVRLVNG